MFFLVLRRKYTTLSTPARSVAVGHGQVIEQLQPLDLQLSLTSALSLISFSGKQILLSIVLTPVFDGLKLKLFPTEKLRHCSRPSAVFGLDGGDLLGTLYPMERALLPPTKAGFG